MVSGPGISVPTSTGTRMLYPARIVAVWIVLTVTSIGLSEFIRRCKIRISRVYGIDRFGWSGLSPHDRNPNWKETEPYTVEDLKEHLEWEREWWRRQARFTGRSVVVGPVTEELIFRGGPFLLALTLDGYRVPLLIAGSLLWAYLHTWNPRRYRQSTGPVFVGGLLYVYLWAVGLWWVAILVHVCNNGVAMALDVGGEWWRRRRHSFTPGEEYTVTVDDWNPQQGSRGLYQAYTPEGEKLRVAGVEPGETTRVRVATTVGFNGYAFPIAESESETN